MGDRGQEGLAMGRETQCQRILISDCFRSEGKGDLGVKGNVLIDNVDIVIFLYCFTSKIGFSQLF